MVTNLITVSLLLALAGATFAQSKKTFPQTKVVMTVGAPIDSAFNYIVPVDLAHIFKRYRSLPAITHTSIKEGWIKPGLIRIVYFEDGSSAKESLLTVVPHSSFSYKIENFTSALRFLAKRIEGDWTFTDLGNGQICIEWRYQIVPKNFIARAIIQAKVMKDVNGMLTNALTILKTDLEGRSDSTAERD
jgi:hypothetical protein